MGKLKTGQQFKFQMEKSDQEGCVWKKHGPNEYVILYRVVNGVNIEPPEWERHVGHIIFGDVGDVLVWVESASKCNVEAIDD